jgi:hypothetical protein
MISLDELHAKYKLRNEEIESIGEKIIEFHTTGIVAVRQPTAIILANIMVLISHNSDQPLNDYLSERDKEWSVNDMKDFIGDILLLLRMMVERKAKNK